MIFCVTHTTEFPLGDPGLPYVPIEYGRPRGHCSWTHQRWWVLHTACTDDTRIEAYILLEKKNWIGIPRCR